VFGRTTRRNVVNSFKKHHFSAFLFRISYLHPKQSLTDFDLFQIALGCCATIVTSFCLYVMHTSLIVITCQGSEVVDGPEAKSKFTGNVTFTHTQACFIKEIVWQAND